MVRVSASSLCVASLVLSLCSLAALGLLGIRITLTDDPHFAFLTWNLFLAWIPFAIALGLYASHRLRVPLAWLAVGFVPWLLFLPNAPYLLTDYIHLAPDTRVPLWFDFALLGSFAASGLLLGFASVYVAQAIVTDRLGGVAGWTMTATAFILTAVGIYVGRVLRLNSWDAVQEPGLLGSLAVSRGTDPLGNPLLLATVVLFTVFLMGAYVVLYLASVVLTGSRRTAQPLRRRRT